MSDEPEELDDLREWTRRAGLAQAVQLRATSGLNLDVDRLAHGNAGTWFK